MVPETDIGEPAVAGRIVGGGVSSVSLFPRTWIRFEFLFCFFFVCSVTCFTLNCSFLAHGNVFLTVLTCCSVGFFLFVYLFIYLLVNV